ncbi:YfbU family protein [Sphingomonas sp. QA11]|uniref:YfbU family protein n=1 Tax=Sphingomonas sp. QA11 TaxID=2950605 RepID=UPI00234A0598|nr:YfbU family protein [Sphingomonas sp. QA11]WCM26296.1 YfbU family protein [Sphingomonas sp. QA11]
MELTKKERLGYIYQLRILEALYPDEAIDFARKRTALEDGYSLHYEWLTETLSDDMSAEECREVLNILDMYRAITFALQKLDEGDALRGHRLAKFLGFDGNNEGQLMAYVRYFIMDLDRFDELKEGKFPSFNSHMPMLDTYRAMLERWNLIEDRFEPSRAQIAAVLGAE